MIKVKLSRLLTAAAVALPLLVAAMWMPACNTVRGVGKDISNAGEDVEASVFGDTHSHSSDSYSRRR